MANKPPFTLPYAHPAVRDLAFLLTAPSPWKSGADIPPHRLLGPDGPALLQALDAHPDELRHWLARQPTRRLGHYAERLLSFWFRLAPHIELVASNLPVRGPDGRTVGEFDFLLRLDGQPLHLEAASKFYLQLGRSADTLTGPSLRDAWALKAHKLQTQLRLSRHPAAQATLPEGFAGCAIGARLSGWLFHAQDTSPEPPPGALPLYGQYWPLRGDWPALNADSRWAWLPRLSWLAPARLSRDTPPMRRNCARGWNRQRHRNCLPNCNPARTATGMKWREASPFRRDGLKKRRCRACCGKSRTARRRNEKGKPHGLPKRLFIICFAS